MSTFAGGDGTAYVGSPPMAGRTALPAMLAIGLVAGLGLGAVARGWMRVISDDPEFSWAGTVFIVVGFGFLGLTQSGAAFGRTSSRRWALTAARAAGIVGVLPLFVAAGALMAPTVILGGLALVRTDWHRLIRLACGLIALGPIGFVAYDLNDTFGWSLRTVVGFLGLLVVYTPFVWATRFTFAPRSSPSPFPKWLAFSLVGAAALVLIIALIEGGIQ